RFTVPTSDDGLIDWFEIHPALESKAVRRHSAEVENFLTHLWPMGLTYQSPFRPRFLIELERSGLEASDETFLVRDGLVPLLWFWKKWPEPGAFRGKLIVGDSYVEYVPEAWRPHIRYY